MQRLDPEHDDRACQNCGRHVTPAFARVFGTGGTVERCRGCDTVGRIMAGSAAGKHVDTHPAPDVDTTRTNDAMGEPVLLADIRGDD